MSQVHPVFQDILDSISPNSKPSLFADESVIRTALMEVFEEKEFATHHPFADVANTARMDFADEVVKQIRRLQAPPFRLGVKLQNYCPTHIRQRLPAPEAHVCADCEKEWGEKLS